jgi:isopenicillin-N epimerase
MQTAQSVEDFRSLFPVSNDLIYLNSGTHSICPRSVTQSVCEALRYIEKNPTANLFESWARLWEIQGRLGKFLNARPDDLFLRSSVTAALGELLLGTPLSPGEILVSDMEYGAIVNIARFRAEQDGRALRKFHIPSSAADFAAYDEEKLLALVVSELRPETRLLLLSHVMTGTGLRLPVREIARETRKRGILLAVDGAHATGALPLDFADLEDVDFYGGSLHKWVMAPKGTSFGWVPERNQASLSPRQPGWTTYELPSPFKEFGGGGHAFAARFLLSTSLDFAPFQGIVDALDFWATHTPEKIRSRLSSLQTYLENQLRAAAPRWKLLTPTHSTSRGPLLAYELPPRQQALGFDLQRQLLKDHGLQVAVSYLQDRWVLRLSPHIYNDEPELKRAVSILTSVLD